MSHWVAIDASGDGVGSVILCVCLYGQTLVVGVGLTARRCDDEMDESDESASLLYLEEGTNKVNGRHPS
jgi:hypothetical protein